VIDDKSPPSLERLMKRKKPYYEHKIWIICECGTDYPVTARKKLIICPVCKKRGSIKK
jgi:hypothetical protein